MIPVRFGSSCERLDRADQTPLTPALSPGEREQSRLGDTRLRGTVRDGFRPKHDACFLPRRTHTTGDVQVHEMAWVGEAPHPGPLPEERERSRLGETRLRRAELWFV